MGQCGIDEVRERGQGVKEERGQGVKERPESLGRLYVERFVERRKAYIQS